MASGVNFKTYDPVAQLVASGGGGGGGLPSTGGTMTGNINMTVPSKIIQCQAPSGVCDLTNKQYVDNAISTAIAALGAPLLPLSGGTMTGAIIQPLAPINANDLTNKIYVDSKVSTPNSIPGTSITNNSITNAQIANNTITSGNIQDGTITGTDIAPATVANSNIVPGPASTIKGTNSLINVDNFVIGTGLILSPGPGPTLSVDATMLGKAGNTQFGVVEFDPSGDLKDNGVNTGIARIKQPAIGQTQLNAGFDLTGNFVASKAGALTGVAVPNGTPFTFQNLIFQMDDISPRSLKIKLVSSGVPTPYIVGGAQPYWDQGIADPPTPFVTGRYIYRNVDTTTFKFLSERTANEPTGSTLVTAPFDTTLAAAPSTTGEGYIEIYNFYINDGIDDCGYRVTSMFFNPNSFIVVERLTS
jgi:hypothetical protein